MRRSLLVLLMTATVALPSAASAQDRSDTGRERLRAARGQVLGDGDRQQQRAERQQQRIERQAERGELQADRGDRQQQRQPQLQQPQQAQPALVERRRLRDGQPQRQLDADRQGGRGPSWQDGQRGNRVIREDTRDYGRTDRPDPRLNPRQGWQGDRNRDGQQDRQRWSNDRIERGVNVQRGQRWSRNWRQNQRYDWQGYRNNNRSAYRLPRYYAPANWGYGYRRFNIGISLNQSLFGSNYWINDPWQYRLPPVDGPFRWVRYYDDVLLIDLRSGQVVDAIYDFFW